MAPTAKRSANRYDPQADAALNVRPLPPDTFDGLALSDGIGLHVPAQSGLSLDPKSRFQLPGSVTPAAPLGPPLSHSSIRLHPALPAGYRPSVLRHANRLKRMNPIELSWNNR